MKDYRSEDILGPEMEKDFPWWIVAVIAIAVFIAAVALSGCKYTENMASRDMDKAKYRHEQTAAGKCASWYPVKVFRDSVNIMIPGKTIKLPPEKIFVNCDSAVEAAKKNGGNASSVAADCPPCNYRVDTNRIISASQAENTARIREWELIAERKEREKQDLRDAIAKKDAEIAALKQSNKTKNKWLWILGGIISAYLIWQLIKLWRKKAIGI